MASVHKRGDKWYAKYKDRTGAWRKVKGYTDKGETLKLARKLEDEAYKVAIGDIDPEAADRRVQRGKPIADHIQAFKTFMEGKQRHPNHVQYTIKDIERGIEFMKVASPAAITAQLLDQWSAFCQQTGYPDHRAKPGSKPKPKPDSNKTVNRRIASVRAWLRYLHRNSAVDRIVTEGYEMLPTLGRETKKRRALTREESAALIAKCEDANRKELYRFALLTGLRRSECASMTPASFNFTHRTITISAVDAKRKTDHQIVPMHSALVEPLKALSAGRPADGKIFSVPNRTAVVPILHSDCRTAGIDTKDVDFHALRHSFCSQLAEQGIRPEILMKLARHRDIATTIRYYIHFKPDDERAAIERL